MNMKNKVESLFERALWGSRYVVVIAVVASLLSAMVLFFMSTWDVLVLGHHALEYVRASAVERVVLRNDTVTHVVEVVDGYLLATFLLIFAFGLYELFISDIDAAKGEKAASKILVIETLDDLKSRLAKVILMILIVRIFEMVPVVMHPPAGPDGVHAVSAMDLFLVAGSLVGIGLALWLARLSDRKEPGDAH